MSLIEREALIRAATDWAEAVLEHGDPAMRSGARDFAAVVDDVLAQRPPGAVTALRNYGSHKWTCAALASTRDRKVPCDCGWDATLAAYRGQ
jgi:hypothetical protein